MAAWAFFSAAHLAVEITMSINQSKLKSLSHVYGRQGKGQGM